MLQESTSTTWDLRTIGPEPSIGLKIYLLFLLGVCIVSIIKLVRVWRLAPPFRASRHRDNPAYPSLLRSLVASLRQWVSCTFLGWGIFASIRLSDVCGGLLYEKSVGSLFVVYLVREFSTSLTLTLLVVLLPFLIQWYVSRRMEYLHNL